MMAFRTSTGTGRLTAANSDGGSSNLPADIRTPPVMGSGDALRRYTGQSPRRRSPYPFPLRANVTVPKPSAVEQAPTRQDRAGRRTGIAPQVTRLNAPERQFTPWLEGRE